MRPPRSPRHGPSRWLAGGCGALALLAAAHVPAVPAPAVAAPEQNYQLREALIAWDMLTKVRAVCPNLPDESVRWRDIDAAAQARLHIAADTAHAALAERQRSDLMTPQQARRVVMNAGGCQSARLGQWHARARWLTDTAIQVLAGDARIDRVWPRQPALERPLRIAVAGQGKDESGQAIIQLQLSNPGGTPARVALLASQTFVGLCTGLSSPTLPLVDGYQPALWLEVPPRSTVAAALVPAPGCRALPFVNVGGTAAVDTGEGVRYWHFLVRGVGAMPPPRRARVNPLSVEPGG
jgi:hypothetical protein